jgi:hypothetical protein
MVKTEEDLEGYLSKLDRRFEKTEDGTFLVSMGPGQVPAAIQLAPPVLVAQVRIGPAPKGDARLEAAVFRRLLEHNATSLLHAAYAIEGEEMVISAALELDALDLNELEAVLADIGLALSEHVPSLLEMVHKK